MNAAPGLAERIKRLAEACGSQRKLAERVGVTEGAVRGWAGGSEPHVENLRKISRELSVSFDWLVSGKGREPDYDDIAARASVGSMREDPAEYRVFADPIHGFSAAAGVMTNAELKHRIREEADALFSDKPYMLAAHSSMLAVFATELSRRPIAFAETHPPVAVPPEN